MRLFIPMISLFVAAFLFLLAPAASAEGFTGAEAVFAPKPGLLVNGYVARRFGEGALGYSSAFGIMDGWAEAYAGPSLCLATWFCVDASVGVETGGHGLLGRYALAPVFLTEKWTAVVLLEANYRVAQGDVTAFFYDASASRAMTPAVSLGAKSRYGLGTGPLAELHLGKTPFTAWAAWMPLRWETGDLAPVSGILGLRADF